MNFAYRDAGLDSAAKLGRGVVVMNPLGGGLIPRNPERFNFVKSREDETVVEGALRFLINDKRITTSLIGFNKEKEVKDAVKAVDGFKPISDEKIAKIRSGLKQAFNELCTSCRYCDKCPKGIPVPKLMEAYNHYMLSGKPIDMLERLKWHWGIESDSEYLRMCNECGICEKACTQKLPIRKRLKDILKQAEKNK
jgi:predicted aldo/keto reductase-like oxidoreductase